METQLAVQEAISAFHTAVHTHSYLRPCSVPQLYLKLFSTRNSHAQR
jgi:hypothetical protein